MKNAKLKVCLNLGRAELISANAEIFHFAGAQ